MGWYENYLARMNVNGSNIREREIKDQKKIISDTFFDSPSYQEVYINSSSILTGVWIIDNSDVKDQQDIISQFDNPINAGDTITWNSEKWLIIVKDDMTDIYHKGTISKCQSSIKWLDSNGYQKETYFTFRSDNLTNFGLDEGRIIDSGNERRHILIPSNVDTRKIKKNKRFVIDERVWKVTAVDRLKKGLVYLVLQEDDINEAVDRIDLGIADYTGNVANYTVTITNGNSFSMRAGTTLQLQAEVKNNGNIVSRDVVWSVSDETIATVDESGILSAIANGTVIVTAKLAEDLSVNDTTVVTVQLDTVNNFSIELNSSLDVLVNTAKTFTAIVKNNLVVDPSKNVMWYLYGSDGVSLPSAASMTFNSTTQCTLKGIKVGNVVLKVVLIGSSPVLEQKFNIKIESLI